MTLWLSVLALGPLCLAAPSVTATKQDLLLVDNNGNGRAESGDTLRYTVTITNTGDMDALLVSFSDTLDTNTTLVPGSLIIPPLALDDEYSVLGNVEISIVAPGVLINDVDLDGVGPALTVSAYQNPSANGGDVSVSTNGAFTYNPPPGFEGTDTFTYSISDGQGSEDTATVSLTVSDMIWFVDAAAGSGGDGRLTAPFNLLTGAGGFAAVATDGPGDNIFLFSGNYAGGLTLLNNQKLIGEGAGAPLSVITGLTPPTGSLPLPATGGTRPTLASAGNNVTLASGNLVRGLDLNSTGNTALLGAGVGTLTLLEMSVNNSSGVGVNLANGSLSAILTAVTTSGGANGIRLVNTTGSFEVTGTGGAGSGGTIQNTTGADGSSNGNGIYLSNVSNVSLSLMTIRNHPNFAIRGTSVNGFTLLNSTVDGVNGTSAAADEGSLSFSGLTGTAAITGSTLSGGFEDNVRIANSSGILDRLTVADSTIGGNHASFGNDGVFVEASGSATVNVTVTNCNFTNARGDLLQLNALNSATMDWVVVDNTFANNHPNIVSGGGGTTFSGGGGGSAVSVTYDISRNTFRDAKGIALNVSKGTGGGTFTGEILNNDIGVSGVSNSGSAQAGGIQVRSSGSGTHTSQVEGNTVYQYNENGIYVRAGDGNSTLNVTLDNNTVAQPGGFALNGLQLNIGATASDSSIACVDIRNNSLVGSGLPFDADFNLRQRFGTTIRLPGYLGGASDVGAVVSFVQGNNVGTPSGVATVSGIGFLGGSPCVQPLLAALDAGPERTHIPSTAMTQHVDRDPMLAVADLPSESLDAVLTEKSLATIVKAAKKRWQSASLDEDQRAALERVTFEVADLSGRRLGAATSTHVRLDRQGAGQGWFVDRSPMDESEFRAGLSVTRLKATSTAAPVGRFDLLTAVMHELGHAAGLTDSYEVQARDGLMYGYLPVGERRLPTHGLAVGAKPHCDAETHYIGAPISIGTLPPGKSITITFDATINAPPPGGLCSVSNQGVVSGNNFADVLTDDPDTGASDDATLTAVNQPDVPIITPIPATVGAGSSGNQASGPASLAGYAWTISNGTITSATNLQTITYSAGTPGNVTLGLTVFSAGGCSANSSIQVPVTSPPPGCSFPTNFVADTTFTDGLGSTTMTLTFDGTNYWSCSGGSSTGNRLARYDASGGLLSTYAPGFSFRSVFTRADGTVLARVSSDPTIYQQTSAGVFTSSGVVLVGGTLNSQSSVVFNGDKTEYIAMAGGVVSRWDLTGSHLGNVTLQGFGSVSGETDYPQNRGIAAVGAFWLTYNGSQILSIWDASGSRIAKVTLEGAGVTFDSSFSLSYCNDRVWIVDDAGGDWRGYDIFASVRFAVLAAEGTAARTEDVRNKILSVSEVLEVDVIPVHTGNPVPTLTDLSKYRSVLVFSDSPGFNDSTGLGNVLADYVDQGGGVIVATFGFYDVALYGVQGRLKTDSYLPFTTSSQAQPGGLTLLKDLPQHPLLFDVISFNGGTASYHNSSISITNGATLVASWSNGQPLVGAKQAGPGRIVGLNFFPPSSDARSDFWDASTDGAQLMVNALLWTGQHPPVIVTGPADHVAVVGETVTFDASVTGSGPLSYQWRRNGADLPGETSTNLTFVAQLGSAGQYSLRVSNLCGVATSPSATLTVISSTNVVLNVADSGWYDWNGVHTAGNQNYVAGNWSSKYSRDWFVFNIPALAAPVTRAELRLHTYSIFSPTGSEIYQLREVTTPVATLQAGGSGLTNIYNDLGDGPIYAAHTLTTGEAGRDVTILLNESLRSAVTAAAGGTFALGGELASLDTIVGTSEYVFGGSPSAGGGLLELVLTVGTGDQPVAGYFTDNDPLKTGLEGPILNAGFVPLHIGNIATQDFSGLRLLLINERSGSVSAALTSRLPDIEAWVRTGGRLIIHDRIAGGVSPNPFLLGTDGLGTVPAGTANLDLIEPATTLVTAGPFGIVDDTTLDGGSSSAHGYLPTAALPAGARAILSTGSNQVACFSYPLDAGFIYYSTIPLDCYLPGAGCAGSTIGPALTDIYTPNVIAYTHEIHAQLAFLQPWVAGDGTLSLYLQNVDATPIAPDRLPQVQVYSSTDVALPLGSWSLVPNPLVLTNGLIGVEGLNVTNSAGTFFRAVEQP